MDEHLLVEVCKTLMVFENATEELRRLCSSKVYNYENRPGLLYSVVVGFSVVIGAFCSFLVLVIIVNWFAKRPGDNNKVQPNTKQEEISKNNT